jgi:putative flippase GtrA
VTLLRSLEERPTASGAFQSAISRIVRLSAELPPNFLSDLWRYGLCSLLALGLDWGVLMLLVHAGMNYLIAATISFSAGMVFAYFGSIAFVYRGRRSCQVPAEAIGFFLIGFAGLLVNVFLLFFFVKLCGLSVGLAKMPTALAVFLFNFLVRRSLLFAGTPIAAGVAEEMSSTVAPF